jgi:predicted GTPase
MAKRTGRRVRVLILGAAGRDFHNFNLAFAGDESFEVVAFTATQIPNIDGRRYPAELAGKLYPEGIPIWPEEELEEIIGREAIDQAVFAYSDVSHETVMHLASRVNACGADFVLMGGKRTQILANRPVLSVCAVRTGCGKSQTSRKIAQLLKEKGVKAAVIRHPMPYGDLVKQRVQRFATFEDLQTHECTIEEIEEYEQYVARDMAIYAGVDYQAIVAAAEEEAEVIIWDGGNNDTPFIRSDLQFVVVDPLRAGHEMRYHPGETNLRLADVVVVNKVDRANTVDLLLVQRNIRKANAGATVLLADSTIGLDDESLVAGKRVLVVEDGPTLTHGGMAYGAGFVAAERFGAAEIVDPRPFASGPLVAAYETYPHMDKILPALGYYPEQLAALEETIARCDCDVVIIGTPVDLRRYVKIEKPAVRVTYELAEQAGQPQLVDIVNAFLERHGIGQA